MIDERYFFDQPVKNDLRTFDNIQKISISHGDHYTTGYYSYFKKYYKLIAIDLSKQQKLNADSKAIQQINFTGKLDRGGVYDYNTLNVKLSILQLNKLTSGIKFDWKFWRWKKLNFHINYY